MMNTSIAIRINREGGRDAKTAPAEDQIEKGQNNNACSKVKFPFP